jgi:transcriptional regulator with XRE-family HTH domain
MKIMKIKQTELAEKSGLHVSTISNIFNGWRRPSWKNAKRLAEVTNTDPIIWIEGSPEEIKQAILNGPDYDRLAQRASAIVSAEVTRVVSDVRKAAMNSEQCHG